MKFIVERKNGQIVGSITDIDDCDAEVIGSLVQDWRMEEEEWGQRSAAEIAEFWPSVAQYKAFNAKDIENITKLEDILESMAKKLDGRNAVESDSEYLGEWK